jgi:hypothetical protein
MLNFPAFKIKINDNLTLILILVLKAGKLGIIKKFFLFKIQISICFKNLLKIFLKNIPSFLI